MSLATWRTNSVGRKGLGKQAKGLEPVCLRWAASRIRARLALYISTGSLGKNRAISSSALSSGRSASVMSRFSD